MAHIVIMGAGLGGMPAAYEMRALLARSTASPWSTRRTSSSSCPPTPGWRWAGASARTSWCRWPSRCARRTSTSSARRSPPSTPRQQAGAGRRRELAYDYLVITTGAKLSFDEVPGSGPIDGHTHSVCTVDHAQKWFADYEEFLKNPGPIVIGAMPGASCFGPAYEFAFIVSSDLRKRKLRHKVPMTFVTSEPYIGHLGLGGVGDSKSMLESELRNRDIKWITNAKTTRSSPASCSPPS
jgi:sulfide:quinone oxidoreductase